MALSKKEKLSASLEDYLEAIFDLTSESKVARSKDIAESLGVARSSVTGALKLLKEKRLINYKPYGYVTLTDSGKKAASEIAKKHEILKSFFVDVLGIKINSAQQAACKAEHALGAKVIARLLSFIEFVTKENNNGQSFKDDFKTFFQENS